MDLFPPVILDCSMCSLPCFQADGFIYFRGFMPACMLLGRTGKCVSKIAGVCFFADRHVAGWERFLSASRWDLISLRECLLKLIRDRLGHDLLIHGAYPAWVDTTLISKVRGGMPGVQKWHDHSGNPDRGGRPVGHRQAFAGLFSISTVGGVCACLCHPLPARLISWSGEPSGIYSRCGRSGSTYDFLGCCLSSDRPSA